MLNTLLTIFLYFSVAGLIMMGFDYTCNSIARTYKSIKEILKLKDKKESEHEE